MKTAISPSKLTHTAFMLLDVPSLYAQYPDVVHRLRAEGFSLALAEDRLARWALEGDISDAQLIDLFDECRGTAKTPRFPMDTYRPFLRALTQRFEQFWTMEFEKLPERSVVQIERQGYHADTLALKITYVLC